MTWLFITLCTLLNLGAATKIICVGDSITSAQTGYDSYRYYLWNKLKDGGYAGSIDFVGPNVGPRNKQSGRYDGTYKHNTGWDQHHSGQWGKRVDEVNSNYQNWVGKFNADIVLIHLGTNDIFKQSESAQKTASQLGTLIDKCRNTNPKVKILLCKIIPATRYSSKIIALNEEIPGLAASKSTANSPVIVVDQWTGYSARDDNISGDGIHPNAKGEQKMATRYYEKLKSLLDTPVEPPPTSQNFVITISVDGLRPDAVTSLGKSQLPNFYKLREQGAFTDNARSDPTNTSTLPNHTTMLTALPVNSHKVTMNNDTGGTLHTLAGKYIPGMFDVAHDHGLVTALYVGKDKFNMINRNWNDTNGATDQTGNDDGKDKIDTYMYSTTSSTIINKVISDLENNAPHLSLVHFTSPDIAGHNHGWMSDNYLNEVKKVDGFIGKIFNAINASSKLKNKTWLILTSDHGGTGKDHRNPDQQISNIVPFYVWGPGVTAGVDLYSLNSSHRKNPGTSVPGYGSSPQPIRNGDMANLALNLLNLQAIQGSTINPDSKKLLVTGDGQPPSPPGPTEPPGEGETSGAHSLVGIRSAATTIQLSWQPPTHNPSLKEYGIVLGANDTNWKRVATVDGSTTSVILTENHGITTRLALLQVRAVKSDGTKLDMSDQIAVSEFAGETKYALTVLNGSGDGQFVTGEQIEISADAPPAGKEFSHWSGPTQHLDDLNSSSTQVTMPSSDLTFTATYKDKEVFKYSLSVTGGSGSGSYEAGATVSVVANPPGSDQSFDHWEGDVSYIENPAISSSTVTMPAKDIQIRAVYLEIIQKHELDVTNGEGSGSYESGEKVQIVAVLTEEPDMIFSHWSGHTEYVENPGAAVTFITMPSTAVKVTAVYVKRPENSYQLTVIDGSGSGEYVAGAEVGIEAHSAEGGQQFKEWTGDRAHILDSEAAKTRLIMPTDNIQIKATYAYIDENDHDLDGMPNNWEKEHGLDPNDSEDATNDKDQDGLSNKREYELGTSPNDKDSDDDGLGDLEEVLTEQSPVIPAKPMIIHSAVTGMRFKGKEIQFRINSVHPGGIAIRSAEWKLLNTPDGVSASLTNKTVGSANLILTEQGPYTVTVKVIDANQQESQSTVFNFTVSDENNFPPVADAGPDQSGEVGQLIRLYGINSSDVEDQKPVTHLWEMLERPADSTAELSVAQAEIAEFTPDKTGFYFFKLSVGDSNGLQNHSSSFVPAEMLNLPGDDIVVVKVIDRNGNSPPRIQLSDEIHIVSGDAVEIDAGESSDLDDEDLTYIWRFIKKPEGSQAKIEFPQDSLLNFSAEVHGTYIVQLTLRDEQGNEDKKWIKIIAESETAHRPVVDAGETQKFLFDNENLNVQLIGSVSDEDNDIESIHWEQIEGPLVLLQNTGLTTATFTIANARQRKAGLYRFKLTAIDKNGFTASDATAVIINTQNERVPEMRGFQFPELKNENGTHRIVINSMTQIKASFDAMGDTGEVMTVFWSQIKGPSVFFKFASESEDDLIDNEILEIQPTSAGEFVFHVYVDDGKPRSEAMELSFKADPTAEILETENGTNIIALPDESEEGVVQETENVVKEQTESNTSTTAGGGGGCFITVSN